MRRPSDSFSGATSAATRARALALFAFGFCCACGGSAVSWESRWDAPYGRFGEAERELLERVRDAIDEGQPRRAWSLIAPLVRRSPKNLDAAVLLQELEVELARRGSVAPDDAPPELVRALADRDALGALHGLYVERLRAEPGLAASLLAARLEPDTLAARHTLEEALEHSPDCAWLHYASAHVALRDAEDKDRWRLAKEHLARALALDPSHLAARRLEAWMLTQEGSGGRGREALDRWLAETEGDPRVDAAMRERATLDLAREWIAAGDADLGLELLEVLEGSRVDRARRYLLVACAQHALDRPEEALDAARRAEAVTRAAALPIVQQAIVLDQGGASARESDDAWRRVIERASASEDIGGLLQVLRARVLLERRERAEREASEAAAIDSARAAGPSDAPTAPASGGAGR